MFIWTEFTEPKTWLVGRVCVFVKILRQICKRDVVRISLSLGVVFPVCIFANCICHLMSNCCILCVFVTLCVTVVSYVYLLHLMRICYTLCVFVVLCVYLLYYVCIAALNLDAGLLARSQYPEGPTTGHLDTGFSWFPCVYKQILR